MSAYNHDMAAKRGRGRPVGGLRPGERIQDYPRLTIRLPRRILEKLAAMARQEGRPQWRVVVDAITERAERVLKP
jgi:hypothetical protein